MFVFMVGNATRLCQSDRTAASLSPLEERQDWNKQKLNDEKKKKKTDNFRSCLVGEEVGGGHI